jgi:hypothetical protein
VSYGIAGPLKPATGAASAVSFTQVCYSPSRLAINQFYKSRTQKNRMRSRVRRTRLLEVSISEPEGERRQGQGQDRLRDKRGRSLKKDQEK